MAISSPTSLYPQTVAAFAAAGLRPGRVKTQFENPPQKFNRGRRPGTEKVAFPLQLKFTAADQESINLALSCSIFKMTNLFLLCT
jgi:hypothetical protein